MNGAGATVGTAVPVAMVAQPVYEHAVAPHAAGVSDADTSDDGSAVDDVFAGLRLGLSRLITAAGLSALVHCILLTVLGVLAVSDVRPQLISQSPVLDSEAVLTIEVAPPELSSPPPVVAKVEMMPKTTAGITPGDMARGLGSAGSKGGFGGGNTGGLQLAGPKIESLQRIGSGGTGGLGTDSAFGTDMMGEAGEAIPSGATFFGVKAEGKSFAFVVDTSGSMSANSRYLRCRDELLRSVGGLHYRQKYFIVFFNHTIFPMPERHLVDARPAQVRQTVAWITGAVPTGFTEPWPGLLMAIKMKPDAIYLLTDGEFSTGILEKVVAAQPQSKKIPIHTIAFESQAGETTLQTISRVTGGTYRYVP